MNCGGQANFGKAWCDVFSVFYDMGCNECILKELIKTTGETMVKYIPWNLFHLDVLNSIGKYYKHPYTECCKNRIQYVIMEVLVGFVRTRRY